MCDNRAVSDESIRREGLLIGSPREDMVASLSLQNVLAGGAGFHEA
jgi:hypothetical protein